MSGSFRRILVANRGAAASRIIRAIRALGASPVAVYSEADANAFYLEQADEAYPLGPAPVRSSYLNQDALIDLIRTRGIDAVHPGYGFLSENAEFARRVVEAGAAFIGPSPRHIADLGYKTTARERMKALGVSMGPSSEVLCAYEEALAEAERIGYPVLMKPAGGGGGSGITAVHSAAELRAAFDRLNAKAGQNFGLAGLYLEKLIARPRHVEFQMLADRHGNIRCLFDRDCSVQRRHQKVIEEAPAPRLPVESRSRMAEEVTSALGRMGYDSIGTVETLYSAEDGFGFLEVNTRLQVEHAVTEEITGIDLVQSQIRLAAGETLDAVLPERIEVDGWAVEARIYAEDPLTFRPSPGRLETFRLATGEGIRIETGYREGDTITPHYDPMIAKLVAWGPDREAARRRLLQSVRETVISGPKTNLDFIAATLQHPEFVAGDLRTDLAGDIIATMRGAA